MIQERLRPAPGFLLILLMGRVAGSMFVRPGVVWPGLAWPGLALASVTRLIQANEMAGFDSF
ncbi:MAG TPA: hypothetical protein VKG25_28905 [Bryobacteraceae bacterium]|nr:hypothetical protein [Bryobacteraceae bacterium]